MPMQMVCPANVASVRIAGLPDCPVSSSDSREAERDAPLALEEQPFAPSEMGESMDTDLLPELLGETLVASTLLDGLTDFTSGGC